MPAIITVIFYVTAITLLALVKTQLTKIMSVISTFATSVKASFDQVSTDLDSISTDIQALNAQIAALQNSSGTVSAEDQALLDDIQAKGTALAAKADAAVPAPLPVAPVAE